MNEKDITNPNISCYAKNTNFFLCQSNQNTHDINSSVARVRVLQRLADCANKSICTGITHATNRQAILFVSIIGATSLQIKQHNNQNQIKCKLQDWIVSQVVMDQI